MPTARAMCSIWTSPTPRVSKSVRVAAMISCSRTRRRLAAARRRPSLSAGGAHGGECTASATQSCSNCDASLRHRAGMAQAMRVQTPACRGCGCQRWPRGGGGASERTVPPVGVVTSTTWVSHGPPMTRCRQPGDSFTWLHPSQVPWLLTSLVGPSAAAGSGWSRCRMGALHQGVRQSWSRIRIRAASAPVKRAGRGVHGHQPVGRVDAEEAAQPGLVGRRGRDQLAGDRGRHRVRGPAPPRARRRRPSGSRPRRPGRPAPARRSRWPAR